MIIDKVCTRAMVFDASGLLQGAASAPRPGAGDDSTPGLDHRLGSPTPDDKRISCGCIHVPVKFYETLSSLIM